MGQKNTVDLIIESHGNLLQKLDKIDQEIQKLQIYVVYGDAINKIKRAMINMNDLVMINGNFKITNDSYLHFKEFKEFVTKTDGYGVRGWLDSLFGLLEG